ncbi:MAG: phospholipase D family protein [Myxococcales bacterium]|nr:phospholipase D family protein [Myxococcales bacterium]
MPARPLRASLVAGRGHYDSIFAAIRGARTSVWIATANLKELLVEDTRSTARARGRYHSVLAVLSGLAAAGVDLRLLHAAPPSGPFRSSFDRHPRLVRGGLELRQCPRVHLKTVLIDGRYCYLGSANWTGAGLGAKGEGRRNFELGIVTDDDDTLDHVQALYQHIWSGAACRGCKLRESGCEAPLDVQLTARPPTARPARSEQSEAAAPAARREPARPRKPARPPA